jgi:hypothetical protein
VTRIKNWQNSTSFSDLESLGRVVVVVVVVVVRTPSLVGFVNNSK